MSLSYIGQQFTIYGGYILLLAGFVGNSMNILIFSSVRIYRTIPSTFYILVGSIDNMFYIIINLSTRILSEGYGIDPTKSSNIWCKARNYFIGVLSLISFSCSCLATIDQFFVTSQNAYLRRCSKLQWAHRIVFIMIIIWCLHGIPVVLFYDISSITNTCVVINQIYQSYIVIYILVLLFAIPVSIMVVFGWMTYLNIRHTIGVAGQRADRQLTRMILMQVILVVISIFPFGLFTLYNAITNNIVKDIDQQLEENFVLIVLSIISYLIYVVCFVFVRLFYR
jgi:hypothetical protein